MDVSRLPPPLEHATGGSAQLFEDTRLLGAMQALGGVAGMHVLELGPLEAGHTYLLSQAGARTITAVEANPRAYLKCLIIKELLKLERAQARIR